MEIKLYHAKNCYDYKKQQLAKSIINHASNFLSLPKIIELEFQSLGHSAYGETDIDRKRITINFDLELNDIVIPLLHELTHLEQIHTGRLAKSRNGEYVWEGQVFNVNPLSMTYEEYKQLPWEAESDKKQKKLIESILGKI